MLNDGTFRCLPLLMGVYNGEERDGARDSNWNTVQNDVVGHQMEGVVEDVEDGKSNSFHFVLFDFSST